MRRGAHVKRAREALNNRPAVSLANKGISTITLSSTKPDALIEDMKIAPDTPNDTKDCFVC